MPSKPLPHKKPRQKRGFGGASVNSFSPHPGPGMPPAVNCFLSFEETLKLHLSLGQLLGYFNSLHRGTTERRQRGLRLFVNLKQGRVAVYDARNAERAAAVNPTGVDGEE